MNFRKILDLTLEGQGVPVVAVEIQPLARELPYAAGATLKSKKKKKKKKRQKRDQKAIIKILTLSSSVFSGKCINA